MSEKDSGMIIHPEILSLIKKRDEIHRLLYAEYTPISAMEQMIGILNEIRREDVDEELHKTIKNTYINLTRIHSRTQRFHKGKALKLVLWGYLREINHILMNKGYLTNEFYKYELRGKGPTKFAYDSG